MTDHASCTATAFQASRCFAAALLLTCSLRAPAHAQSTDADSLPPATCPQGRVSDVFVDNHSVFDLSDPSLNPRFDWFYRLADRLHPATRRAVVRRELLVKPGDCYDVERLRDSERLLRDLDFIAAVDIFGVRQPDGTIHVIVDTRDEWSLRVGARLGGTERSGLTRVEVGEANLFGTGRHLAASWEGEGREEGWDARYYAPQFLGTRWDAFLRAGRTPVGALFSESLAYPFVGETGRWAMVETVERDNSFFEYLMPGDSGLIRVWYPQRHLSADLGIAYRWGKEWGQRTTLGAVITGRWVAYPEGARYAGGTPTLFTHAPPLPLHRDSIASVRANVLLGQRDVYYVDQRGLNTVHGTEDVRLGVESQLALGPSIPALSTDHDFAVDYSLFLGAEMPRLGIAGANLSLQARRNYNAPADRPEWSDVFAQFDGWMYLRTRPESTHEIVGTVSAVAGWHDVVPFQLTLGGHSGLRGYPGDVDVGGRRVVATLEHRHYLGWPLPELFDLGAVEFVDVGHIWQGDTPFSAKTPLRADVGVGLRVAFPPGSRQTFRLDVGVPLEGGLSLRGVVFTVGMGQLVGFRDLRIDSQLLRSTGRGVSSETFNVPR